MKKIILIISMLLLLCSCKKKENTIKELTITEMNNILFKYADTIERLDEFDENGDYKKFDKKDNQYFISLKDLSKKYKYNFDNFINKETHKECDKETSGIYFDTDNVRKLEYFKNPIVIDLKCE